MTKNTEEIILQEIFNLNNKIDKFQDEVREKMVTKEELGKVKEELKEVMVTKEEFKEEMNLQARDITHILDDISRSFENK